MQMPRQHTHGRRDRFHLRAMPNTRKTIPIPTKARCCAAPMAMNARPSTKNGIPTCRPPLIMASIPDSGRRLQPETLFPRGLRLRRKWRDVVDHLRVVLLHAPDVSARTAIGQVSRVVARQRQIFGGILPTRRTGRIWHVGKSLLPHGTCQLSHKQICASLRAVAEFGNAEVVASDPFVSRGAFSSLAHHILGTRADCVSCVYGLGSFGLVRGAKSLDEVYSVGTRSDSTLNSFRMK